MRIGIVAWLHESNTFCSPPTELDAFRNNLLVAGSDVRSALSDAHHEVGGFFTELQRQRVEAVPLFAARALPSGTIAADCFDVLLKMLLDTVTSAGTLDGILVAPHGATVSQKHPDADGYWLQQLRQTIGPDLPIIGTLDAHANLSADMVNACTALTAYRSNPHLDQKQRGEEAARLMVQTVRGEIRPTMAAAFPPLAISIDRQCTDEPHLKPLYDFADQLLQRPAVLSDSVLLGFPYADVAEMGSSVIVVTDNDRGLAEKLAAELAGEMWTRRQDFAGQFISAATAVDQALTSSSRTCLLDMGDNVGGGSSADGTELLEELCRRRANSAFVCVYDPEAVAACDQAGVGQQLTASVGGKTDRLHGNSLPLILTVISLHDGKFSETQPRHGGITNFDQGRTAVCRIETGTPADAHPGLVLMLTSRRMVPFSLEQLRSCALNPADFQVLVAKGVNAPIAAYREVCERFIRVNTIGSTCADMSRLTYSHRRKPLFPLEPDAVYATLQG
ncbi:MAG: M81 family metallopeptidase [Planctomycetaceae bacterium]|nr:M81 family metallopeptidase [Planctomycetaceae bacterium]